ncbi:RtcB family protein [Desulfofundulus salinus]|uniref:3'-phosphate/5'-hydroxy nucleic acid ligase n=1 Tax=Desulfofundulus salinus TaxID=2419843 RepID=A0A494WXS2_9FIRM|nr:RtcB family protein [Desulfofundulus salinum]RKO67102.1 RtcB family protein [Desulfofundulus salinum]
MKVITTERLPIKIWAREVEEGALEQARHLANHPYARHHIALMPDVHQGYGMPIGGVLATEGVIIPNAVGVDVGCGVQAVRTNQTVEAVRPRLRDILNQIQRAIPTGFNHHKKPQSSPLFHRAPDVPVIRDELENARYQLGTLGGGNHFIEIQRDDQDYVWIMLHSGSRNFGKKVADYYNRLAINLNERYGSPVPREWQLAYLPLGTQEGQNYLAAMQYCLEFARENRAHMMRVILEICHSLLPDFAWGEELDVHHNYASLEKHFGQQVMVHRKGAVRAVGDVIVPGSMGSPSYICRGLANRESFASCSHGAGRVMGRNEARRRIPVEKVIKEMQTLGVELFKAKKGDLAEECRQAYKDIDQVMEDQKDLVEIKIRLQPLGVVKG